MKIATATTLPLQQSWILSGLSEIMPGTSNVYHCKSAITTSARPPTIANACSPPSLCSQATRISYLTAKLDGALDS
ncbi:4080_t:CDS:2 [Paraglomus brasilianum]|uniref:4080_t:CDS:1 n=1 Tax=Paraglomus brasilianum TaxID=144538 RepID=A0A9N9FQQ7_9GLOM|nr:4080_t:CDS:2 [Paraglomus brasilianum]